MKPFAKFKILPPLAALMMVAATGCNRDHVQVYNVDVDTNDVSATTTTAPAPEPAAPPMAGSGAMPATMPPGLPVPDTSSLPPLKYTLPAGWQEKAPSQMRVASFGVSADGKQADVSVIPLGGMAGGDLANVNRWRGQVGLPPLADDDLTKLAEKVQVAGEAADLYDMAGTGETGPERILGVIFHRNETVWFFKMTGDPALVEKEKPSFIALLQSIQFGDSAVPAPTGMDQLAQLPPSHPAIDATMPGGPATMPSADGIPAWTVPADWQVAPLEQFLLARFVIPGAGNAQAAVNISELANAGGGLSPNVNRWRAQIGLDPLTDDAVAQLPTVDASGSNATLVDFSGTNAGTGQPARLVGVILPLGSQTWFYKLMGDPIIVAAQKDAFVKFIQSAKYPGTP